MLVYTLLEKQITKNYLSDENAFIKTNPKPNYTDAYKVSKTGNPNEFLGVREDLTPEKMLEFAKKFRNAGATILGGCCETRPSHIKAFASLK